MRSKIAWGALAGIIGGIAFGVIMQMMLAPTPEGGSMPMMKMVAMVVRSESLFVGWLYHLFNSAIIGALFGLAFGARATTNVSGAGWGAVWGVIWWILGGLILMPIFLGMPAFASLRMPPMRPVAMGSLIGHFVYGVITGIAYVRLHSSATPAVARPSRA